jgi:multicomponent Na+:H+ antiporter subunit C
MNIVLALAVGVLFAVSTYFLLKRSVVKLLLGVLMLSYGTELLIFMMGDLSERNMPILELGEEPFADPIPQALILTAIVIGFGFISFALMLAYRFYFDLRTEDLDHLVEETEIHG